MEAVMTRRNRLATPERWQAALKRAIFAGIEVRQLAGSGQWIATSGSNPDGAYETDGVECTCAAALLGGDPVCLHRAAYWYALGELTLDDDPEPPTPAAHVVCARCLDTGRIDYSYLPELRRWYGTSLPCPECRPAAARWARAS